MNKTRVSLFILLVILIIAAFLRLYRIEDYMAFLGDEGRDALIVKRMIVDHKFTLLGPITSVGLMHLGPAYYYFMAPFLWAANLNPVGPAIMVALFSLATIVLMWQIGREFIGMRAGLIASLLYAVSSLVIIHSHSSWNPNILPFWSLLIIYSLCKVLVKKKYVWLTVTGVSLGIAIQLHYVALVFFPIILVSLALCKFKVPIKYMLLGIFGLFVSYSPYILFELRHQFINTQTVLTFITRSGDARSFRTDEAVGRFWDLTVRLFWRLIVVKSAELAILFVGFIFAGCLLLFRSYHSNYQKRLLLAFFGMWYFVGIGILSLYAGNVFDYYLMFAFPLPFLLTGMVFSSLSRTKLGAIAVLLLLSFLLYNQFKVTPILSSPNRLAAQAAEIADFILEKAGDQPYNFALMATGNSDHAYRYYLEVGGKTGPVIIENEAVDPQRNSVTAQLFIVCEQQECHPLGFPLWEIAGFGRAEIEEEWQVGLFTVFKLVPYRGT